MNIAKLNRNIGWLNWLAFAGVTVALLMNFFYAPIERSMGNVQRLFYFHVGSAWVACIALFVALVCGIWYLAKPSHRVDTVGLASVEIGLVLLSLCIVSGSIWGRPAWNTYWIWSPRLTSITVAWLTYAAYFMLRGAIEDKARRARFAAVYVLIAFVTVILSYGSIRILRDIHPVVFGDTVEGVQAEAEGLQEFESGLQEAQMGITLTVNLIAFHLLYFAWLANRLRLQHYIDKSEELKMRVTAQLQGGGI